MIETQRERDVRDNYIVFRPPDTEFGFFPLLHISGHEQLFRRV